MPNFDTDESDCSSSENGSTIHEFYLSDNDNFDDESDDNVDNDAHGGVFDDFSDFDGVVHAYVGVDAAVDGAGGGGVDDAADGVDAAVDDAGDGVDAAVDDAGDGVDPAGTGVDAAGAGVDAADDGVDAAVDDAGDGVDPAGAGVDAAGDDAGHDVGAPAGDGVDAAVDGVDAAVDGVGSAVDGVGANSSGLGTGTWNAVCRPTSTVIFLSSHTHGPTEKVDVSDVESPLDYFNLVFDDDFLELIVNQTNLYAVQYTSRNYISRQSRVKAWKPTSKEEMRTFLGLSLLTGVIDKKGDMSDYWSTDKAVATSYFNDCISRNRFQLINKFIHFNDNEQRPTNCQDRLYKIRPIYDHIIGKWRELYQLGENIAIDEGMLKWRGRLKFKVYMKNKPIKYGLKFYILADSLTHYCWNVDMYHKVKKPLADTVEGLLTEKCHDNWHTLYMDNFYNSVKLSEQLLTKKIHTVGTLRKNRGEPSVINSTQIKRHEVIARDNGKLMVLSWKDHRIVTAISTKHDDSVVPITRIKKGGGGEVETIMKPKAIVDYNNHMSGVDHLNQMIAYYPCTRKTQKWTKKVFMYLMSITVHNSFILYKARTNSGAGTMEYRQFLIKLSKQLTMSTQDETETCSTSTSTAPTQVPKHDPPERLQGGFLAHELLRLPYNSAGKQQRRRCRVCSKNKLTKLTAYICKNCNIALCPAPCYRLYHCKRNYY